MSKNSSPEDHEAARCFQQNKNAIIQTWASTLQEAMPSAKEEDSLTIIDHIPNLLDKLIATLSDASNKDRHHSDSKALAREHGRQRAQCTEYKIEEIIKEYSILRRILNESLSSYGHAPTDRARHLIDDFIDESILHAVSEFVTHTEERRKRLFNEIEEVKNVSAKRLYSSFMNLPVGISIMKGEELEIEYTNRVFQKFFQAGRNLEGKRFIESLPVLSSKLVELYKKVIKNKEPLAANEISIVLDYENNGTPYERIWNFMLQPLPDIDSRGRVERVLTCAYEISEIIRDKNIIQENEHRLGQLTEQLELIADSIPIHLLQLDENERFLFVNKSASEMWGMPIDKLKGKRVPEIIGEEKHKSIRKYTERVLTGESVSYESPFTKPNGEVRTFINTYSPKVDADGKIRSFLVSGTDITERKRVESKLAFESQKLEVIFQESPAGMCIWRGKNLIFEKVNPVHKKIFSGREVLGKSLIEAIPELEGQGFDKLLVEVLNTGKPYHGYEVLAQLRGENDTLIDRYFDFTFLQIVDADGNPYGVFSHAVDVTDRVKDRNALEVSKAKLQKSIQDLEQEREARERFVATLSHDLRTPLTAAKLSAQLMTRKLSDPSVVGKISLRIAENLDRADQMIHDLLDSNLIKAGKKLPLEIDECNLSELVELTLEELSTIHGDRFKLEKEKDVIGYWSCSGLRRMLENLCNNAIKYGSPHRPVTVSLNLEKEAVLLKVHNEGTPILSEDQDKLFEPFRRTNEAMAGQQHGWGLGLTLVKGIVEAHGGRVDVESSQVNGTIFEVYLPLDAR